MMHVYNLDTTCAVVSYVKNINPVSNFFVCRRFGQCLNNGIFLGKPNTDILDYLIHSISYDCSMLDIKYTCISNTTGPIYFDTHIFKYMKSKNKSKILILDHDYLEPCTLHMCEITGNTYIKHEHNLSWLNSNLKELIKLYLKYMLFFNILIVVIFLMICL